MFLPNVLILLAVSVLPNPLDGLAKELNSDRTFPRAVFSSDDRYLAYTCGSSGQTVALWDLVGGTIVRKFRDRDDRIESLVFSPNGEILAGSNDVDSWLWEVASGKCIRHIQGRCCRFSPDGKSMITADNRHNPLALDGWFHLHVWETATGKHLHSMRMPNAVASLAVSADGQHVAVYVISDGIRIWNIQKQKEAKKSPDHKKFIGAMAFSPSGRELAYTEGADVYLWDLRTGNKCRHWNNKDAVQSVAFSPEGRWIAWGGHVGDVRLARTKHDHAPWRAGQRNLYVQSLAFSADGQLLAACTNNAVHVFEAATGQQVLKLTALASPFPWWTHTRLTPPDVQELWTTLAKSDASNALAGMWRLAADPPASVSFLKQGLKPIEHVDRLRLKRLIENLSSDDYRVRTQASEELEKLGASAEFAFTDALKKSSSVEFKRRAELILDKLNGPITNPELLRGLRALKVLEHIGTKEARQVISVLAQGDADALLTQLARESLLRHKKKLDP